MKCMMLCSAKLNPKNKKQKHKIKSNRKNKNENKLFKSFYHKKKEYFETSTKTVQREFLAVKHIAYALYMIGDEPGRVSQDDYVCFEKFDVKDYKSISDKAWKLYVESNVK